MLNEVFGAISCHFYSLPTSNTTFISKTDFPRVSQRSPLMQQHRRSFLLFKTIIIIILNALSPTVHADGSGETVVVSGVWARAQYPQLSLLILTLVLVSVFQEV